MAIFDASDGKTREINMKNNKKSDKKLYLVAHELKLARVLAGNNKPARDRALKALKQWFTQRSKTLPFTEDDFQRIWKGLFYAMWMSDKLLVQEQCAEDISSLVHFPVLKDSLLFYKAGMTILRNEWFGIDQLRLDKFLMLVRRLLRQVLITLKKHGLSRKNINEFTDVLSSTILNTNDQQIPIGLFMHFTEIFLEEFAKVTNGHISRECFVDLLKPFIKKLVATDDHRQTAQIRKFIFVHLIRQTDLGFEYQAKYEAWKREGFPGNINSMQKVKLDKKEVMRSEDKHKDTKEKPLDPRAGRVNVELPQIKFDPRMIAEALLEYKFDKASNAKSRKVVTVLAEQFTKLANGVYPLGTKRVINDDDSYDTNIRKATNRLVKFEKKLLGKNKKRKRETGTVNDESEVLKKRRRIEKTTDEQRLNKKVKNKAKSKVDSNALAEFIENSEGNISKQLNVSEEKHLKVKTKKRRNAICEDSREIVDKESKNKVTHNRIEKKRKKKKPINAQTIIDNIECVFERNSGTWVVYDVSKGEQERPTESLEYPVNNIQSPDNSSKNDVQSAIKDISNKRKNKNTNSNDEKSLNNDNVDTEQNGSPKSGLIPVKLFESPQKPAELFPKSEWDEPLQEGEYEICIPSKKFVAKTLRKKNRHSVHELINSSLKINRLSLGSKLEKIQSGTPNSAKKVKINTKLNMSQEVHEHHATIRNSPGIPYDANRKPLKPLLKTVFGSSPINPFYNKQLNIF